MPQIEHVLRRLGGDGYLSMDLDPAADGRNVMAQGDVTAMPFRDGAIDFAILCHVLEHVPDDRAAMREIRRVLSGRGFAIVQTPWTNSKLTDEDPSAPEEERIRRFGQPDHVRKYGKDLDDRLRESGLRTLHISPTDILSPAAMATFGLHPKAPVWIVQSGATETAEQLDLPRLRKALRLRVLDDLVAAADKAPNGQVQEPVEPPAPWRRQYERLADRLPRGVVLAGRRMARIGNPGNRPNGQRPGAATGGASR